MGQSPRSFTVYGFKIEVRAGGRRVWPPSFKRFIKDQLDSGALSVGDVVNTCNVSQSLVYKWRAGIRRAGDQDFVETEKSYFSEVVIDTNAASPKDFAADQSDTELCKTTKLCKTIRLRSGPLEIELPANYPVDDLLRLAHFLGVPR